MYSKVIVPLDESQLSEQALFHGQLIASSMSVPIELAEAYDILPPAVHDRHTPEVVKHMLSEAQHHSEHYLLEVQERLKGEGIAVSIATLQGLPADAIATLAGADPEALIVMTTHGRGGIARWALGSVADKVLHTVPNPIFLVHAAATGAAEAPTAPEVVLVPLDGSARAELCLPHVGPMATALGADVLLLRVTPTLDYYRRHLDVRRHLDPRHHLDAARQRSESSAQSRRPSAEELLETDAEEVEEYLQRVRDGLALELSSRITTRHLLSDNVAEVIIDSATERPCMVIMTTHGRSGIGRLVLGSVTDRVVRHSNLPVLVVR